MHTAPGLTPTPFGGETAMLDMIAALTLAAMYVIDVTVLVGLARIRTGTKFAAFLLAAAWAATIVGVAALGGFAPGATGPLPGPGLAFGILVLGGLITWFVSPAFRHALLSLPLAALIGINGFRLGGIFFLLLMMQGRLSAPFAPSAGWGDIATALIAIPLTLMVAVGRSPSKRVLAGWNAFGALDLIVAITLGLLSAPGTPFQVFTDPPGTRVLTTLPWVGVPTLLVPLYLLTHLTIAARLRSAAGIEPTRPGSAHRFSDSALGPRPESGQLPRAGLLSAWGSRRV
jgi:hypothetical protein